MNETARRSFRQAEARIVAESGFTLSGFGRQFTQASPRGLARELNLPRNPSVPDMPFERRAPGRQVGDPRPLRFEQGTHERSAELEGCAMSRESVPVVLPDLSAFARALARQLKERELAEPPGHVEMLNLLARAAGYRNVQALRAAHVLPPAVTAAEDRPPPPALTPNARKALMQFDSRGRLVRWPHKFSVQRLAMWVLWTLFDGKRVYTEREVNAVLKAANDFGDHVTLRRELINHRLLTRKSDCSEYRKLPARPDEETRALLAAWRARGYSGATGTQTSQRMRPVAASKAGPAA